MKFTPLPFVIAIAVVVTGCQPLVESCPEADFHVRQGAIGGDGSPERPFGSITEAIASAPPLEESCEIVTVNLPGGVHEESVVLGTRGLSVVGGGTELQGRFENRLGATLMIENLSIRGAQDFAIHQEDGELRLRAVSISETRLNPNDPSSGTAIRLRSGVRAALNAVTLEQNASQGLSILGPGAQVSAALLVVRSNSVHPVAIQLANTADKTSLGAIEIGDGAEFSGQSVTLQDNAGIAVAIANGSRARFEASTVRDTTDIDFGSGRYSAGFRIQSSEAELVNVLTRGAVVGLHVIDSYLTYQRGTVQLNAVGVAYFESEGFTHYPSNYNHLMCWDRVYFRDNDTNMQFDYLPLPDDGPTPASYCRRVPAFTI